MREALAYTRTVLLLLALSLLAYEAAPRQMELLAAGSFPLVVAVRTGRREETPADCQLDPDLGESDPDSLGLYISRVETVGGERWRALFRTRFNRLVIRYASLLEYTPLKGLYVYSYKGRLYVSHSKPSEVDV